MTFKTTPGSQSYNTSHFTVTSEMKLGKGKISLMCLMNQPSILGLGDAVFIPQVSAKNHVSPKWK